MGILIRKCKFQKNENQVLFAVDVQENLANRRKIKARGLQRVKEAYDNIKKCNRGSTSIKRCNKDCDSLIYRWS